MCHRPTVVLQGVACPDTTISIIQSIIVRVPSILLPSQMPLDDGPHLAHISGVGIKLEMPKQFINIHEIHIIMMELIVLFGIAADITIAIHRRTPLIGTTRKSLFSIHQMRQGNRHIRHLTLGISTEMNALSVLHTQEITSIGSTPAIQRHTPTHCAMIPHLAIPCPIRSHDHDTSNRIQVRVRSIKNNSGSQVLAPFLRSIKTLLHFGISTDRE